MKLNSKSFQTGYHYAGFVDPKTGEGVTPSAHAPLVFKSDTESEQKTYSVDDLPVFGVSSATFPLSSDISSWFPPQHEMKYDIILVGTNGDVKATITSRADMERLMAGEPVECNWYKRVGKEWEFVIRNPLKFNFKKTGDQS